MRLTSLFCVLALSCAASAATLNFTITDLGSGKVAVGYNASTIAPAALAFKISAPIESVISSSSLFAYHPSNAVFDGGNLIDYGSVFSPSTYPGVAGAYVAEMAFLGQPKELTSQYPADLNYDFIVNGRDLTLFSSRWLQGGIGDLNADGAVNFLDYPYFLAAQEASVPLAGQLLVIQLSDDDADFTITPESTYRGGVVGVDGTVLSVAPLSVHIPEPASMALLAFAVLMCRKKN